MWRNLTNDGGVMVDPPSSRDRELCDDDECSSWPESAYANVFYRAGLAGHIRIRARNS